MMTINQLLKLDRRCRLLIQCPNGLREVDTLDLAEALESEDHDRPITTWDFDFELPDFDPNVSKPKLGSIKAKAYPHISDAPQGVEVSNINPDTLRVHQDVRLPSAQDGVYLPSSDIIRLPNVISDTYNIRLPSAVDYAHPMSVAGLDDYDRVIVTNDLGKPGKYQARISTISPTGATIQNTLLTESIWKSSLSKGVSSGLKGQGLYLAVDLANNVYQAWLDGTIQSVADAVEEVRKYVGQIPQAYVDLAKEIVVSAVTNNADRLLPALAELTPVPLAARVADSFVETIEKTTGADAGLYPTEQLDVVYDYILDRPTGTTVGGSLSDGTVTITESFGASPDRVTTYSAQDSSGNNVITGRNWSDFITSGHVTTVTTTGDSSSNPIAKVADSISPVINTFVASPYSTPYGALNAVTGGAIDRGLEPIRSFISNAFH